MISFISFKIEIFCLTFQKPLLFSCWYSLNQCLPFNFVVTRSFNESDSSDSQTLWETDFKDSIHYVFFLWVVIFFFKSKVFCNLYAWYSSWYIGGVLFMWLISWKNPRIHAYTSSWLYFFPINHPSLVLYAVFDAFS